MHDLLLAWGYPALFLFSFLAATIVPLGSEWMLAVLLAEGFPAQTVVLAATAGNTLGAVSTWALGLWGSAWLVERVLRIDAAGRARAERAFARWGRWVLLLSWLPLVGDPLCLVAGVLRVPVGRFVPLVLAGKLLRYALVAGLVVWI